MSIKWSLGSMFCLMGAFGCIIALVTTIKVLRKGMRYRYFLFSEGAWIIYTMAVISAFFGELLLFPVFWLIDFICLAIGGFFLLMESDSISRESVDPIKQVIYAFLVATSIFVFFTIPDWAQIQPSLLGGEGIAFNNILTNGILLIMFLFPMLVYGYTIMKMNRQAPPDLKRYARTYLAGLIIGSYICGGFFFIIPPLGLLICGIGTTMMAVVIARHPKLIFILPFKALRLTALDTNSGIPLFQYNWATAKSLGNEDLYAGMLQGINLLLKESLNRGDVQEIKLAQATLLACRDEKYPVACVLVANKTSKVLRDALQMFAGKFYNQYSPHFANSSNVAIFSPATNLVEECFPFLPSYD